MKWNYESITAIGLELSSKCNAACPACPRHLHNSRNLSPDLVEQTVSFSDFKKWFPPELLKNIRTWLICGTHGDPLVCKDLYEILEYICEYSPGEIRINTNGGIRTPAYFKKIGTLFAKNKSYDGSTPKRSIAFSVDGLQDTNHIYRRNVVWKKVWDNMMAYVKTGAITEWDFLLFRHNAADLEKIKHIAKQYDIRLTIKNPYGIDPEHSMPVYDKSYNLEYIIENATGERHLPVTPLAPPDYSAEFTKFSTEEEGHIECYSFRNDAKYSIQEVYINSQGYVNPCEFVGNTMNGQIHGPYVRQLRDFQKSLNNANSLHHYSLKEIIENKVLDFYSDSWKSKSIELCWRQCGKNKNKDRFMDNLFVKKKKE